jgi:hypothetical protein
MTKLLEKAFAEAAKLPADQQDAFAQFVLAELHAEERLARAFPSSQDELANIAKEALEDHKAGPTRPL